MKSNLVKVGALLGVVLVAASAWFLLLGRGSSTDQRFAESVKASRAVYMLYFGGDYDAAKRAVVGHVEYLDKLSSESGDPIHNPHAVDAIAWVVRLSKLEERFKRRDDAEYMGDAIARCEKLGDGRDCSPVMLLREVDRMDNLAEVDSNTFF